jgi:hypothetical protein
MNKPVLFVAGALIACALLVGVAFAPHRARLPEAGARDASTSWGSSSPSSPRFAATTPYATGTGIEGVISGSPATAAINGDAGFVLTATGTSTLPTFQAAPSGFTAGGDLSGTSTSQSLVSGLTKSFAGLTVTTALHGYVPDAGVDDYGQVGEKLVMTPTEVCVGDAGAVVCSGNLRSQVTWTDATTWTTFLTYTPAARTIGAYDIEFVAFDIADAPDAGPVDFVRCTLQLTGTTSNGGNVSLVSEQSHAGLTSPVTLLPSGVSAITGGVLATTTTFAFRAQVSSGQVQIQATGIASKTYNLAGVYQHARGSGH